MIKTLRITSVIAAILAAGFVAFAVVYGFRSDEDIEKMEVVDFPELGMEAVRKIEVRDFPAFIVVDDKGNDFYAATSRPVDLKL